MALMTLSKLIVANWALRAIGMNKLTQTQLTNQSTNEAILVNDFYDLAVNECLSKHWWRFANKVAALTEDTTEESSDYEYVYEYPDDAVKVRRIGTEGYFPPEGSEYDYIVIMINSGTSKAIACDVDDAYVEYTCDASEDLWSPQFAQAVAWTLASKMVVSMTESARSMDYCQQQAEFYIQEAKINETDESQKDRDQPLDSISSSRF